MNKSYKRKVWKRAGVILFAFFSVAAVLLALYEYRERNVCEKEKMALEEQIRMYVQTKVESEESVLYAENVRKVYLEEAELAEHLMTGDRIDIRIRYFNAEDYLVLADKLLVRCDSGNGMVLELTEEEILLISSAITDCKKYDTTKLYAVEYPEGVQLEAGRVNYIAGCEVLAMLGKETTEGESRIALERRLAEKIQ